MEVRNLASEIARPDSNPGSPTSLLFYLGDVACPFWACVLISKTVIDLVCSRCLINAMLLLYTLSLHSSLQAPFSEPAEQMLYEGPWWDKSDLWILNYQLAFPHLLVSRGNSQRKSSGPIRESLWDRESSHLLSPPDFIDARNWGRPRKNINSCKRKSYIKAKHNSSNEFLTT